MNSNEEVMSGFFPQLILQALADNCLSWMLH